jgi:hypothetical protein
MTVQYFLMCDTRAAQLPQLQECLMGGERRGTMGCGGGSGGGKNGEGELSLHTY